MLFQVTWVWWCYLKQYMKYYALLWRAMTFVASLLQAVASQHSAQHVVASSHKHRRGGRQKALLATREPGRTSRGWTFTSSKGQSTGGTSRRFPGRVSRQWSRLAKFLLFSCGFALLRELTVCQCIVLVSQKQLSISIYMRTLIWWRK